jgi:hypothetical protein
MPLYKYLSLNFAEYKETKKQQQHKNTIQRNAELSTQHTIIFGARISFKCHYTHTMIDSE